MNALSAQVAMPADMTAARGGGRGKAAGRLAIAVFVPLTGGAVALLVASSLGIHGRWQSAFFYAAQLGVGLVVAMRLYGLDGVGLGGLPRPQDLVSSVAFVALRLIPWFALVPVVGLQLKPLVLIPALAYFLFLNAAAEELLLRGLVFKAALGLGAGVALAAIASSVGFGLLHVMSSGLVFIPVFVADGLAFCALRIRSGSLYPPIAAHALLNFATGALLISNRVISDRAAVTYVVAVVVVDLAFTLAAFRVRWPRRLEEAAQA